MDTEKHNVKLCNLSATKAVHNMIMYLSNMEHLDQCFRINAARASFYVRGPDYAS